MDKITIYTDGGCRGNPGIGGWGVYFNYKNKEKKLNGYEKNTTNNRMELTAAIKALQHLKIPNNKNIAIILFTDSKYLIQGLIQYLPKWQKNNWQTANKKPVKNIDLWQQLTELNNIYSIDWRWVKGHSSNKGNDIADTLANEAMDKLNSQVKQL